MPRYIRAGGCVAYIHGTHAYGPAPAWGGAGIGVGGSYKHVLGRHINK